MRADGGGGGGGSLQIMINQLLHKAYDISQVVECEDPGLVPLLQAHLEKGREYLRTGIREIEGRCSNILPECQFLELWGQVKACLLQLADDPWASHTTCMAGVKCLVRDRSEGAVLYKFEQVRRQLHDCAQHCEVKSASHSWVSWGRLLLSEIVDPLHDLVPRSMLEEEEGITDSVVPMYSMTENIAQPLPGLAEGGPDNVGKRFNSLISFLSIFASLVPLCVITVLEALSELGCAATIAGSLMLIQALVITFAWSRPSFRSASSVFLSAIPLLGVKAIPIMPAYMMGLACISTSLRLFCLLIWTACSVIVHVILDEEASVMGCLLGAGFSSVFLVVAGMTLMKNIWRNASAHHKDSRFYKNVVYNLLQNYDFTAVSKCLVGYGKIASELKSLGVGLEFMRTNSENIPSEIDTLLALIHDSESKRTQLGKPIYQAQLNAYVGLHSRRRLSATPTFQDTASYDGRSICDASSNMGDTSQDPLSVIQMNPLLDKGQIFDSSKLKQLYDKARTDSTEPEGSNLARELRSDQLIKHILTGGSRSQATVETIQTALAELDEIGTNLVSWDQFSGMLPADPIPTQSTLGRRRSSLDPRLTAESTPKSSELRASNLGSFSGFCGVPIPRTSSLRTNSASHSNQGDSRTGLILTKDIGGKYQKLRCPSITSELDNHLGIVILEGGGTKKDPIGTVIHWNPFMEETCILHAAEIEDTPFQTLLRTEREQEATAQAIASVLNGEQVSEFVLCFLRGDGEKVSYVVNVVPCQNITSKSSKGSDQVMGVMLLCTVQQSHKPSRTKLNLVEWLIDQLRYPLVAAQEHLRKSTESLKAARLSPSGTVNVLKIIETKIDKLLDFAKRAKTLASIQLQQHPTPLRATLNKLISDCRERIARDKGITLELDIDPVLPTSIYADSEKLVESVGDLMCNAISRARTGGHVMVSAICLKQDPDSIATLILKFWDDGPTMSPERMSALFTPTLHTSEEVDWRLCNVRIIVEEMGGYLNVESNRGKGTEFLIALPLMPVDYQGVENAPETMLRQDEQDDGSQNKTTSCLVIEPNSYIRGCICDYLWCSSLYSVMAASSYTSVLKNIKRFQVLICGLTTMSDSEQEFIDSATKTNPDLQLILVLGKTALNPPSPVMRKYLTSSKVHLLEKPFITASLADIMSKVNKIIDTKVKHEKEIDGARKTLASRSVPWKKGRLLGIGSHGKVFEAVKQKTGGVMAVKIIAVKDDVQVMQILKEIDVMSKLQHPNIIHYFYCEKSEGLLHLFMEFAANGSLAQRIKNSPLDLSTISRYTGEILLGLEFLHSNGICHRDLKPANILLSSDNVCKIGDFGCAIILHNASTPDFAKTNGTPLYMSPEVLKGLKHNWTVDIWSLGCIVMELLSGGPPFRHLGQWNFVWTILCEAESEVDLGSPKSVYRGCVEAYSFVQDCLRISPNKRPTAKALRNTKLVAGTEFTFMGDEQPSGRLSRQASNSSREDTDSTKKKPPDKDDKPPLPPTSPVSEKSASPRYSVSSESENSPPRERSGQNDLPADPADITTIRNEPSTSGSSVGSPPLPASIIPVEDQTADGLHSSDQANALHSDPLSLDGGETAAP
eukprot:TRINITY_DN2512_c3_g1_i1.p1 TRINITY_DN2512_c3_g1~~TRINITY_DN2512_c3_g1_i1.p1  ORF type:complete len:1591 (+),score=233.87 TRINITY_DN2512_c3_g1_i1:104-4876(+)